MPFLATKLLRRLIGYFLIDGNLPQYFRYILVNANNMIVLSTQLSCQLQVDDVCVQKLIEHSTSYTFLIHGTLTCRICVEPVKRLLRVTLYNYF